MKMKILPLLALIFVLGFSGNAAAQCANPAGVEGDVMFNETFNAPQYCDGSDNWIAMNGGAENTGYIPNAVEFDDATPDYLELAGGLTGVSDTKTMTGSFWFRTNTVKDQQAVLDPTDGPYIFSNGDLRFNAYNPAVSQVLRADISGTNLQDGNWHHILYSFDLSSTSTRHIYVNDVAQSPTYSIYVDDLIDHTDATYGISSQWGLTRLDADIADYWFDTDQYIDLSIEANRRKFIDANGNPVYLGANGSIPTGSAPDIFLSGDTENWHTNKGTGGGFTENGTLTTAATSPYSDTQTQIVPSGLVGHWRLDETSGTTAFDSSGNGNHGISDSDMSNFTSHGIINKSAQSLDWLNNSINVADNSLLNPTAAITVSAWVKSTENGTMEHQRILNKWASPNEAYILYISPQVAQFRINNTSGIDGTVLGTTNIRGDNKWHHVVGTYDGSILSIYVDGVLENTNTFTGSIMDESNNLQFGEGAGPNYLIGSLDDVRLYNRAITAEEVAEIYAARDGIRYNPSHRTMEYFDQNQWVSMTPQWGEVDVGPIYGGYPDLTCPNIGDVCSDGSVYAGISPDGDIPMYTTPAGEGTYPWNNGNSSGTYADTAATNCDENGPGSVISTCLTGEANTAAIIAIDADTSTGGVQPHQAAQQCADLTAHGNDDWYLPSMEELWILYNNQGTIGGFISDLYWSSSEDETYNARRINFGNGAASTTNKENSESVRCVRRADNVIAGTGGLIGHWRLDETSGTTAVDSSGNGNNGTLSSGVTPGINGAVGNAAKFDNTSNAYITIANESFFDFQRTDAFSLSAWIYRNNNSSEDDIIEKVDASADYRGYAIWLHDSDNELEFDITSHNATNVIAIETTGNAVPTGAWAHVVATYNGSSDASGAAIYVNGIAQSTNTIRNTLSASIQNNEPLLIGTDSPGGGCCEFNGMIDDVRIYSRALSSTEIAQLYNMGTPVGSITALPQGCPNIGDVCDDGTIYAGLSPDGSVEMFTTPADAPGSGYSWDNGSSTSVDTALVNCTSGAQASCNTGAANTNLLITLSNTASPYEAAQYCHDLIAHGSTDWYLPAFNENEILSNNSDAIGGFVGGSTYPTSYYLDSSSEVSGTQVVVIGMDGFTAVLGAKSDLLNVRCVRKGPAPRCANPYGMEGDVVYNTTHDVMQFCDGARWRAIGK